VLSRRLGGLQGRGIGTSALRVLVVSGAAAGVAWVVANAIGWSDSGTAIVAVVLGLTAAIVVAGAGLWLLRVEEFRELAALVRLRRRPSGPVSAAAPGERASGAPNGESDAVTP